MRQLYFLLWKCTSNWTFWFFGLPEIRLNLGKSFWEVFRWDEPEKRCEVQAGSVVIELGNRNKTVFKRSLVFSRFYLPSLYLYNCLSAPLFYLFISQSYTCRLHGNILVPLFSPHRPCPSFYIYLHDYLDKSVPFQSCLMYYRAI